MTSVKIKLTFLSKSSQNEAIYVVQVWDRAENAGLLKAKEFKDLDEATLYFKKQVVLDFNLEDTGSLNYF